MADKAVLHPIHGTRYAAGQFYAALDVGYIPGTGFFRPEVKITEEQFFAFRRFGGGERGLVGLPFPAEQIPVGADGAVCRLNVVEEPNPAPPEPIVTPEAPPAAPEEPTPAPAPPTPAPRPPVATRAASRRAPVRVSEMLDDIDEVVEEAEERPTLLE